MQHALAHRAPMGAMVSRSRAVRCRAATKSTTAVKTPDKFIPPWRDCYQVLKSKGVRTIAPEEAQQLMSTGEWVLLDVRCAWACGSGCVDMQTVFKLPSHQTSHVLVVQIQSGCGGQGSVRVWWAGVEYSSLGQMRSRMGTDQASIATLARDFGAVWVTVAATSSRGNTSLPCRPPGPPSLHLSGGDPLLSISLSAYVSHPPMVLCTLAPGVLTSMRSPTLMVPCLCPCTAALT